MNRSDWGIKRNCLECSTRFYDFNKNPIICPNCGAVIDPEYLLKRKTKNSQEKVDDISNLKVDVEYDDLQSDVIEDIEDVEDNEELQLTEEKQ